MTQKEEGGLAYRSPVRAVFFWCIMAMLVWGVWAEGMIGGWTAVVLLAAAAVLGWWLIKTRPENDEITSREVNDMLSHHRD
ncbi:hypothetical protein JANAI62_34300 [Jannaschia pagri]|uniref:Uncharacterized protein n=1 Tax=Jannaschia pagri TaxID=2829797 RepID=A0ABQ4NRU5_9RHOB|nr:MULTISPECIES: hypothetical protein [unclassified Jannaschia]GIT92972.1 hypothetical protein JANAI61_34300 [Jannaschia sp. AI_61]GIT96807.1 hypothetical protein JANAI62_34300 [Jannaschia sp. AI_62]